jgi:cytochrome oxidase Cu insertion factor (SCO1/SenC/PrrC family)
VKALVACLVAVALLAGPAAAQAKSLDDLLWDLQLVPLEGQEPPAFSLEDLAGKRVSLADLRGRPALLYFWASW